jgi:hypothetical protein
LAGKYLIDLPLESANLYGSAIAQVIGEARRPRWKSVTDFGEM